jgi:hypothetical protein
MAQRAGRQPVPPGLLKREQTVLPGEQAEKSVVGRHRGRMTAGGASVGPFRRIRDP